MMFNRPGKIILFSFIAFVSIVNTFFAQTPFSSQKNITVYDGLSNNKVTAIFQDSRGFIWIGTEDGLNRYDGYRVVVYRHEPLDSASISGNLIQAINETSDGNLWIGTRNYGLNIWNRKTDNFTRFQNESNNPGSLPENEVCGILVTKENNVWIKTRNYLSKFNPDTKTFSSYGHYTNLFKPGKHYQYPLMEGYNNTLWVGTKDGLNKFNLDNNTFSRILAQQDDSESLQDLITGLITYNDSTILVSTLDGIKLFNTSKDEYFSGLNKEGWDRNAAMINLIVQDHDKRLWLGTKDGLKYYQEDYQGQPLQDQKLISLKIIDDEVTSITEDRSGILWVGTRHKGVYKFNQNPSKFLAISAKDQMFNLPTYNITSLLVDQNNQLWLGTSDDGIYVINRNNGDTKHYSLGSSDKIINIDAIHSLFMDSKSQIWIGTNHGLYIFDDNTKRINEFDYCNNKEFSTLLKDNVIRAIAEDNLNNLWIGTKFGLYKYNGNNLESFFCEPKDTSSLCDDEIYCLLNDSDGWLWIGTKNGINIYKPSESRFFRIQNSSQNPFYLSNDYILSIDSDVNDNIWIGTRTGLTKFNKLTKTTTNYLKKNGLENDVVNGVLTDDMGRAWISTNKGISLIGINGDILNFSVEDGLAGYVFNIGSVFKSSDGELFFGGFDGVSYLSPDLIELNIVQPNVIISSVTLSNKGEVIKKWTGEVESIEFKYQKNGSIRFEYSGLEFTQPTKNRYRVYLDGFDDNWRTESYQNNITFSNLPPGSYLLKVKGANNDNVWNSTPTELKIKIKPPLWRSNYAYAFYIIAFIFLLQSIINFRVRYYRKAYQALKEKAVDKKRIEAQKEALSKINKSLTDSINYAKRIQEGMLASDQFVKSLLKESFIYLRPKDIVSGDFYYIYRKNQKLFVAAVDCTGHGVPGAFMSIIGYDLIRNIIEIQGIDCPATILNNLNRQLLEVFKKDMISGSGLQYEVNDGMDLSLVVVDYEKQIIDFAGANNSLYMVRDNEIENISGSRYPIGYNDSRDIFTSQEIPFTSDDIVYIFSDGYVDQFGGPESKKFKYRRFRHLLLNIHKLPFEDQKAILHQKMEEWMGDNNEQVDDMLLIGFKLTIS